MLSRLINKIRKLLNFHHDVEDFKQATKDLCINLENQRKQNEILINELKYFIASVSEDTAKSKILHDQIDLNLCQYKRATPKSFGEYEGDLEGLYPKIYPIYKVLFENGKRAYESTVEGNFSNWNSIYSNLFTKFVFRYIHGRVLDIGCGTDFKPTYLSGYPDSQISAIEPLELNYQPEFEVVRGFSEFLPWPDSSFGTVIAATSLDHVLNLEVSLNQIKRVLLPNGLFILWISSMPNAKAYNPANENFKAEDEFHLFHFDSKWLDPLLGRNNFDIVDKTVIPQPGFDHVFYCLQSKK